MNKNASITTAAQLHFGMVKKSGIFGHLIPFKKECKSTVKDVLCVVGGCGSGRDEFWASFILSQLLQQWKGPIIRLNVSADFIYGTEYIVRSKFLGTRGVLQSFISPTLAATADFAARKSIEPKTSFLTEQPSIAPQHFLVLERFLSNNAYISLGGIGWDLLCDEHREIVSNDIYELLTLLKTFNVESLAHKPVVILNMWNFIKHQWFVELHSLAKEGKISLIIVAHSPYGFSALNPESCDWLLMQQCQAPRATDTPPGFTELYSSAKAKIRDVWYIRYFWSSETRQFEALEPPNRTTFDMVYKK